MKRLLALLTIGGVPLWGAFAKVGQAGAKFLSILPDPKAVGMGETYVAVASDPLTVFINPAGVANIQKKGFAAAVAPWWVDTYVGGMSVILPGKAGNYAFFMSYLNSSGFQEWRLTESGDIEEGSEFSYTGMQLGGTYARYFTDKFAAGVSVKGVYEGYGPYSKAWTFATDVGTYYKTGFHDLVIGMAFQHFGPDLKPSGTFVRYSYESGEIQTDSTEFSPYPLPLIFRVGMAMSLVKSKDFYLKGALEITHPNDNVETYAFGFEYGLADMIFLRAGYKFGLDQGGLSAGFGLKMAKVSFDYSFSDMEELPDVHRVGLGVSF